MINAKENAIHLINPGECLARILKEKMQKTNNEGKKGNKGMWKLIVAQKRKSDYSDHVYEETVVFYGNDINELSMMIVRLSKHENGLETSYKLEKEGEKE